MKLNKKTITEITVNDQLKEFGDNWFENLAKPLNGDIKTDQTSIYDLDKIYKNLFQENIINHG